jgi:hypothetical protein
MRQLHLPFWEKAHASFPKPSRFLRRRLEELAPDWDTEWLELLKGSSERIFTRRENVPWRTRGFENGPQSKFHNQWSNADPM